MSLARITLPIVLEKLPCILGSKKSRGRDEVEKNSPMKKLKKKSPGKGKGQQNKVWEQEHND